MAAEVSPHYVSITARKMEILQDHTDMLKLQATVIHARLEEDAKDA